MLRYYIPAMIILMGCSPANTILVPCNPLPSSEASFEYHEKSDDVRTEADKDFVNTIEYFSLFAIEALNNERCTNGS